MSNVIDEVIEGLDPLPDLLSVMSSAKLPALLALDIGTSGVRASLFDERGLEIDGANIRIKWRGTDLLDSGMVAADILLEQVAQAIDLLFADVYGLPARIDLVAVSCFWHSLVGVNSSGEATTPVYAWNDLRSSLAARQLRSQLDEAEFHRRTGCRFHPSYWPAKLIRLLHEEPAVFNETAWWLSFSEYLALQFFGEASISVSMASGTGLLNQRTCEWEMDLLDTLKIDVEKLPRIAPVGKTLNKLTDEYALRWPQLNEARLFPAIGDGAANNLGADCLSKDCVALMIGTSGAMRVVYEGPPPHTIPPELWCYRLDRDRVVVGGALSDGGNLYSWIRNTLLAEFDAATIETELAAFEPDAHGLTILPFWSGERSTGWHENLTGTIEGLRLDTQPIEVLRAVMEAVAYRFALIGQALAFVAPDAKIMASGYALYSSPVWVQTLADVLGRRVQLSRSAEASIRGAALLALESAGKIQRIERVSPNVDEQTATFEPDMTRHQQYQKGLERQQHLYEQVIHKTNPESGR